MAAKRTKAVGLTGGIGSGKSTAARILEQLGARVFYADDEARRIMQEDPEVRRAIVELLGPESYLPDGTLNRAYIARRVFNDPETLQKLNRIVHPRVFEAFQEALRQAEAEGLPVLVMEAALIYETGADAFLDRVIVVDAPEEVRIQRVMARDGVPEEAVRARMRHQLPPEVLRRRADYVVENTGDLEHLRRQLEAIYREILTDP